LNHYRHIGQIVVRMIQYCTMRGIDLFPVSDLTKEINLLFSKDVQGMGIIPHLVILYHRVTNPTFCPTLNALLPFLPCTKDGEPVPKTCDDGTMAIALCLPSVLKTMGKLSHVRFRSYVHGDLLDALNDSDYNPTEPGRTNWLRGVASQYRLLLHMQTNPVSTLFPPPVLSFHQPAMYSSNNAFLSLQAIITHGDTKNACLDQEHFNNTHIYTTEEIFPSDIYRDAIIPSASISFYFIILELFRTHVIPLPVERNGVSPIPVREEERSILLEYCTLMLGTSPTTAGRQRHFLDHCGSDLYMKYM